METAIGASGNDRAFALQSLDLAVKNLPQKSKRTWTSGQALALADFLVPGATTSS
jgi:hypothetical protein